MTPAHGAVPGFLASGSGDTPLVLLHGMGSSAEIWLPQLQYFGRQRLTLAWTMPGYGSSPRTAESSWAALAEALAALLDRQGIARIHLLGHSIGGMVAQEFYHRYPRRVRSLVLSATTPGFGKASPEWIAEFLRLRAEPLQSVQRFGDAADTLLDNFMGPALTPWLRQLALYSATLVDKDQYLEYMRLITVFDRKKEFAAIAAPTLLLAAELDTQAPPKAMRRMAEQLPSATLIELPQLNHMANIESPAAFNRAVEDFLVRVEAAPAPARTQA